MKYIVYTWDDTQSGGICFVVFMYFWKNTHTQICNHQEGGRLLDFFGNMSYALHWEWIKESKDALMSEIHNKQFKGNLACMIVMYVQRHT